MVSKLISQSENLTDCNVVKLIRELSDVKSETNESSVSLRVSQRGDMTWGS